MMPPMRADGRLQAACTAKQPRQKSAAAALRQTDSPCVTLLIYGNGRAGRGRCVSAIRVVAVGDGGSEREGPARSSRVAAAGDAARSPFPGSLFLQVAAP